MKRQLRYASAYKLGFKAFPTVQMIAKGKKCSSGVDNATATGQCGWVRDTTTYKDWASEIKIDSLINYSRHACRDWPINSGFPNMCDVCSGKKSERNKRGEKKGSRKAIFEAVSKQHHQNYLVARLSVRTDDVGGIDSGMHGWSKKIKMHWKAAISTQQASS